jgi:beta-glucosidase
VRNTGQHAGQEIVQLYVRDIASSLSRPEKELKGFAKVALAPGETKSVTLTIDREALAYWDDAKKSWVVEAGEFEALVGSSSQDIRARAPFRLTKTSIFGGPEKQRVVLGIDTPIKAVLADDAARAVVEKHLPGFSDQAQMGITMGLSLVQMAGFAPEQITQETLQAIAGDLEGLTAVGVTE